MNFGYLFGYSKKGGGGISGGGGIQPPPPCERSVGGVDGTKYNETYPWKDSCKMFEG
jgi:hypothetical protein